MSSTEQTARSAGGFGKVLNSLQGLQQRLEDFSIADVNSAEANARTLMLRLKQFQETIAAIALLKNVAANLNQSIAKIQKLDTDVVGMDSLENHPQLHAIIKASKLIKLQKLMAALKAGANGAASQGQPDLDPATAALTSVKQSTNFPSETFEAARPEPLDHVFADRHEPAIEVARSLPELEPSPLSEATTGSSSVPGTAKDSTIKSIPDSDTGTLNIDALADFPTAEAEFETAIAAVTADFPHAEGPLPCFPAKAEQLIASPVNVEPPAIELSTDLPQPAQLKQGSQIAPEKKSKARNKKLAQIDPSKALVPTNESFDLRLLDELVSNYGEFASNPNLPVAVKKKELQPVAPKDNEVDEIQPEPPRPAQPAAPVVKKHGDLDRQLKKIIKDYGEYDIYSDKPTTNIKKAGILAFVLLGLVFGGMYFFKAPPSTAKTAPAASNSSSATPDEPKPQTAAAGVNGDSRDTAPGSAQDKEKITATNK